MRMALLAAWLLSTSVSTRAEAGAPSGDAPAPNPRIVVLVSADTEWKAVLPLVPGAKVASSPYGEWFVHETGSPEKPRPVILFHGGWGKIAAAGSAQYTIDRWKPRLLVNLGTCGGFRGAIERDDILLVDKTVVYDIVEQMGDSAEAIAAYATEIDVRWAGRDLPRGVRRGPLVSADRDLVPADLPRLRKDYGAVAGDWESGAIAWVAKRNGVPVVILRGVTDLVGQEGGEAYGQLSVFEAGSRRVMKRLIDDLPEWLLRWEKAHAGKADGGR